MRTLHMHAAPAMAWCVGRPAISCRMARVAPVRYRVDAADAAAGTAAAGSLAQGLHGTTQGVLDSSMNSAPSNPAIQDAHGGSRHPAQQQASDAQPGQGCPLPLTLLKAAAAVPSLLLITLYQRAEDAVTGLCAVQWWAVTSVMRSPRWAVPLPLAQLLLWPLVALEALLPLAVTVTASVAAAAAVTAPARLAPLALSQLPQELPAVTGLLLRLLGLGLCAMCMVVGQGASEVAMQAVMHRRTGGGTAVTASLHVPPGMPSASWVTTAPQQMAFVGAEQQQQAQSAGITGPPPQAINVGESGPVIPWAPPHMGPAAQAMYVVRLLWALAGTAAACAMLHASRALHAACTAHAAAAGHASTAPVVATTMAGAVAAAGGAALMSPAVVPGAVPAGAAAAAVHIGAVAGAVLLVLGVGQVVGIWLEGPSWW